MKRFKAAAVQIAPDLTNGTGSFGMQEIYQVTSALKSLPFCKHVAVLTDARFQWSPDWRLLRAYLVGGARWRPHWSRVRGRHDRNCD